MRDCLCNTLSRRSQAGAEGSWSCCKAALVWAMGRRCPFCLGLFGLLVFFFPLPHSSRYSLLPCCFLSASCQSSSGISRGCSLASLSLHLIRRLICFAFGLLPGRVICIYFKNALPLPEVSSTEGHTEWLSSSSSCGTARVDSWKNTWKVYRTG